MEPRKINQSFRRENFEMLRREDIQASLPMPLCFQNLMQDHASIGSRWQMKHPEFVHLASSSGGSNFRVCLLDWLLRPKCFSGQCPRFSRTEGNTRVYRLPSCFGERLRLAMQAAHRAGLTLNSGKCQFGIQDINLGVRWLLDKDDGKNNPLKSNVTWNKGSMGTSFHSQQQIQ